MDDLAADEAAPEAVRQPPKPKLDEAQRRRVAEVRDGLLALAVQVGRRCGGDVEDLHQLAMEIACRRVVDYDPTVGQFLTYLYSTVWYGLVHACSREQRERDLYALVGKGAAKVSDNIRAGETISDFLEDRREIFEEALLAQAASAILAFYTEPPTPEASTISAQERAHLRRRVDAALASLEEVDRRIVVRHAIDDVPLAEVQRELGIGKYSEIRTRYVGAMARLAKRLKRVA